MCDRVLYYIVERIFMEKIGLLIDSTTLTRDTLLQVPFVKVASLNVSIDDVDYRELDITTSQMIEHLHSAKKMLTSQPSPGEFLKLYEQFHQEGYTHVVVITLSDKISGTYQSAQIASTMMDFPLTLKVFAPQVASFGVANVIPLIQKMISDGASFDEVVLRSDRLYSDSCVMFTLSDLMHLFRGGRLNRIQALLGTVLRIKPIIEMVEGKLALTRKERTNQACYEYFMDKVETYAKKYSRLYIDIIQLNKPEWAEKLKEAIESKYPTAVIHMTSYVSPVFFVHLGDQGFGLSISAE